MSNKAQRQQRAKRSKAAISIYLSFVILLILIVVTFYAILNRLVDMRIDQVIQAVKHEYRCERVSQQKQLTQHGAYWVYWNFVSGARHRCNAIYTQTMQGNYEDIYKLPALYDGEYSGMLVSFAVYVPDEWHFNQTLKAIGLVRECIPYRQTLKDVIKKMVSFHLYFRQDQVSWSLISKSEEFKPNCYPLAQTNESAQSLRKPETGPSPDSASMAENIKIVGYNVAQLAAPTKVLLNSDPNNYPNTNLFVSWLFEVFLCVIRVAGKTAKTVFRLPTFALYHMNSVDLRALTDKRILDRVISRRGVKRPDARDECYPISDVEWMRGAESACSIRIPAKELFESLLYYDLNFFAEREDFPLLPEHFGLTLADSSNLRLYSMALQEFEIILSQQMFLLHNVTVKGFQPHHKFDDIDANIKKQYEVLFTATRGDNE